MKRGVLFILILLFVGINTFAQTAEDLPDGYHTSGIPMERFQVRVILKMGNLRAFGRVIMLLVLKSQREKEQIIFSIVYGYFMISRGIPRKS